MAVKPTAPAKVTGVILNVDGGPMSGAQIYFQDLAGSRSAYSPETVTGPAGAFAIVLPAGRYLVYVQPPYNSGYPIAKIRELDVRSGTGRVDYRYTGFKVTGTVTEPGGGPLGYGYANANGDSSGAHVSVASGSFSMVLPGGTYFFSLTPPPGLGIPAVSFFNIHLASDTTLVFSLDGHAVSGTVTGPGGQPLPGARVEASNVHARSDAVAAANGAYVLYVPTGDYMWSVQPGSLNSYITSRQFPQTTVAAPQTKDFDLSGVTWSGVVRRAGTGQPVPGARVSVYGNSGYGFEIAGAGGEFMLVVNPHDVYSISASTYSPSLQGFINEMEAVNDSSFDILVSPGPPPPFFTRR